MQVHIKTIHDSSAAVGWTGPRTVVIDRTSREGGQGIGFSGAELLLMAIGASICNDLFRHADTFEIKLEEVEVIVNGDWAGDPLCARNVRYDVKLRSDAPRERLESLVKYTHQQADVPHTLRTGTNVRLNDYDFVKVEPTGKKD